MNAEVQRDIGKHEGQIEALEQRMETLDADLREMRADMRRIFEKLEAINSTLSEAKGGWKVLMLVGGCSAVVGGVIFKIGSYLLAK